MSNPVTIRRAMLTDAEGMRRAHRRAVMAKGADHYSPEQINAWSPEATPERIAKQEHELTDDTVIAFVAENADGIIGFSMAVPAAGELRAVYAAPNVIGGVGAALLKQVETAAQERGALALTCDASLNAEAFYRKHGYEVVERTIHTLNNGAEIPCVKMTKRFPSPK